MWVPLKFPAAAIIAAALLSITMVPTAVAAQGTRAAPAIVTRGKPLDEWMAQAGHYIPELRREAMRAIATLGPGARQALPVLIRGSRDDSEEVRFWAVEALRRVGPAGRDAVPALVVVLSDDTHRNRERARLALEAIGRPSVAPLVWMLRSPDPWIRANAAEALGVIGVGGDGAAQGLARLLVDDSLWVRASAAWGLGHLGPDAKPATGGLRKALGEELRRDPTLSGPAARVRIANLVYALGRIGPAAARSVPLVVSVLLDGPDSLRIVAGEALAGIGRKAAATLGRTLRGGPIASRLAAARSLQLLGAEGKDAVPEIIRLLQRTDELEGGHDLVIATADALGAMGTRARAALKVLEKQRKVSVTPDVVAALDRAIRKLRLGS